MIGLIGAVAGAAIQAGGAIGAGLIAQKGAKAVAKEQGKSQLLIAMAQERVALAAEEGALERARIRAGETRFTVGTVGAVIATLAVGYGLFRVLS